MYLAPYVANHRFLEAQAHNDDGMYAYYAVKTHAADFAQDVFYRVHDFFINTSLTYFGTFWIVDATGIPLRYPYLLLLAIMFFTVPLLYVFLVKDKVTLVWIPIIFLITLLSKYYSWNLSNHNDVDFPYRADISIPFLYGGILLLLQNRRTGYALLGIGGLFHPAMALYALTAVFFLLLMHRERRTAQDFVLLFLAGIATLAPSGAMLLSGDFARVPDAEVLKLLLSNMHFLPWESPYLWKQSVLSVTAFFLLFACCSLTSLDRLGVAYRRLIFSSLFAAALWMSLHVAGVLFKIPTLLMLSGLRSVTLLTVIAMPVLLLYLIDRATDGPALDRTLALFTLAAMAIGKPYGLFVSSSLVLAARELARRYPPKQYARTYGAVLITLLISVIAAGGVALFADAPSGGGPRFLSEVRGVLNVTSWDSAPASSGIATKYFIRMLLVIALCVLLERRSRRPITIALLVGLLSLFFIADSVRFYQSSGDARAKDLYDAQIWANQKTGSKDLFIVYSGSWRSFSERPTFVPRKLGYYMYKPDMQIKQYDDLVFAFYGIRDPYDTYSQKELAALMKQKYDALTAGDFIRLARQIGASYLVEERKLDLPVAYSNGHYSIYFVGA